MKHVLVAWRDVPAATQMPLDPRALERDKAAADNLISELARAYRGGQKIEALMAEHSEDFASATNGRAYEVAPEARLVESIKRLTVRLGVGEAGLVKSVYGWHLVVRVAPPPPDPLDSAEILARAPRAKSVWVKQLLLGWEQASSGDPRGKARTRKELDKLVKATLARLAKGEKIEKLMRELSEDDVSSLTGIAYEVDDRGSFSEELIRLALRLEVGEIGVVRSRKGIHILFREE